ncbi:MAG: PorV/PorQ family protein [Ignavibacteriales bacterium]|nr:MAG: PorV/PorQ family protein [Ignavibacteriales bacterium]
MKKFIILTLVLFAALQSDGFSQITKTGTTAAKFLSIGVGPRANAMGGAFTSIVDDATALYWNPAGAATQNKYTVIFTHSELFKGLDIGLNYAAIILPIEGLGSLGASVTSLDFGQMDVTTELYPEGTGEKFTAASYAFGLTYARNITDDFVAGISVKYIREIIFNSSADGVAFDIGTIFNTPFYGIKFSSAISNYGSKMQISGEDLLVRHDSDPDREGNNETTDAYYKTDKFDLPLKLQIGVSKEFQFMEEQSFTLAIDATHSNDNSEYLNLGGELSLFNDILCLRGGYKALFLEDSQEGLTFGVGVNYGLEVIDFGFDYAFQKFEYLGDTHSFAVKLKF